MSKAPGNFEDTIVALATPPGIGAIGVIRLSGFTAIQICNGLFPSKNLELLASHTLHVGHIYQQDKPLDEVVISLYRAPGSYTGENVVEISSHGSPYIIEQIIQLCLENGARLARPGEFTLRAFLNGKLDLAQAEAVADLIASNTQASHRTALQHMRGGFSKDLKELREELVKFSALIELELDFSQEDVRFADRESLLDLIRRSKARVGDLSHSFKLGNVIKNGVNVVIAGKPNAGKSTLLNALVNENRALVSDIPGTTRDSIEEVINIQGILFRLVDTAGIREHSTDLIENMGMERTQEMIGKAGLVLYVFDAMTFSTEGCHTQEEQFKDRKTNYILVGNKVDLIGEPAIREKYSGIDQLIFISAKAGQNLDELKLAIVNHVLQGGLETENTLVSNARHHAALQQVFTALQDVERGLLENIPGDLLALDIRRSLHYIGEITGEITNEEQLNYIFSKFCIGK